LLHHNDADGICSGYILDKVFSKNELPEDIKEIELSADESDTRLFKLISKYNYTSSNGEAKRLMKQGGIKVDNDTVKDLQYTLDKNSENVVKVGKKKFVKLIIP